MLVELYVRLEQKLYKIALILAIISNSLKGSNQVGGIVGADDFIIFSIILI